MRSRSKYNLEGKRWYQYAAPRIYCKHCGIRLRGPLDGREGWVLLAWLVFVFLLDPFVIQPLTKQYGFGVLASFFGVVLLAVVYAWSRGKYRKWDEPQS